MDIRFVEIDDDAKRVFVRGDIAGATHDIFVNDKRVGEVKTFYSTYDVRVDGFHVLHAHSEERAKQCVKFLLTPAAWSPDDANELRDSYRK